MSYIHSIWPKSNSVKTKDVSYRLETLCIHTGDSFPEAVDFLRPWFQPHAYPNPLVEKLCGEDLCLRHPHASLDFLDMIIPDDLELIPSKLKDCLDQIQKGNSKLVTDPRFDRLITEVERR